MGRAAVRGPEVVLWAAAVLTEREESSPWRSARVPNQWGCAFGVDRVAGDLALTSMTGTTKTKPF